jgi:hypothetical protein
MRRLICSLLVAFALVPATHAAPANPTVLQRFLALPDPAPTAYRALRHLDARSEHFDSSAWMDVWTEATPSGFTFQVVGEGGSEYIRSHVFLAALNTERRMWAAGEPDRAALTPDNYVFEDRGEQNDGLAGLAVKPRKKGVLFVEGSIFLRPDDGELMRVEGRLTKAPSFWTRRVEIVRWYRRFAGVRMPVVLESVASVLIAGRSTFRMEYEYESVNAERVGTPTIRASR